MDKLLPILVSLASRPEVIGALTQLLTKIPLGPPQPAQAPPAPDPFSGLGAQAVLTRLGYYTGPSDGDMHSAASRAAVETFQRAYNSAHPSAPKPLRVDGWLGVMTTAALVDTLASGK